MTNGQNSKIQEIKVDGIILSYDHAITLQKTVSVIKFFPNEDEDKTALSIFDIDNDKFYVQDLVISSQ